MRHRHPRSPDSLSPGPRSFTVPGVTRVQPPSAPLQGGFQLLELLIALATVFIGVAIAVPSYTQHVDKAHNAEAAADIMSIAHAIDAFYIRSERYPDSLAEVGLHTFRDPWGNPYRYLRIAGAGLKGKAALRKDKKLNPVNSDFDLYSTGKDGDTKAPFTAKPSWDDVVRASNGRFVGLAADY
jgi:general secretion pathway protein G